MTIPKSLESLEQKRVSITDQIAALGDLRGGSVTSTTGRCGKPSCHCHQPKDPGHGPNLRLTYKAVSYTHLTFSKIMSNRSVGAGCEGDLPKTV